MVLVDYRRQHVAVPELALDIVTACENLHFGRGGRLLPNVARTESARGALELARGRHEEPAPLPGPQHQGQSYVRMTLCSLFSGALHRMQNSLRFMEYCAMLCCTVLYCAVLYSAVLLSTSTSCLSSRSLNWGMTVVPPESWHHRKHGAKERQSNQMSHPAAGCAVLRSC